MNVLIIEDDVKIQGLLVQALQELELKLQWTLTDSAGEAYELAQKTYFDFFIVDIQLVDYKGTDLVEQIRQLPSYKFSPIVFATAVISEELHAYRDLKCFYYLIKPYTKLEIQRVIHEVLEYLKHVKIERASLRIEQKGFIFEYPLQDILFIESFGKKMSLHIITEGGIVRTEQIAGYSLKGLLSLLDDHFVQCHKSYVLNTSHIEYINKVENIVKLRNHSSLIPIGTKYRKDLI